MDDVDRRLIGLLQQDASRPLKTLAAEVGLARSSVRERIERLEKAGVIRRYTIEVAKPEGPSAVLMVRLSQTPLPSAVNAIVAMPEVFRCRSLSGDIDLLVEIAGDDIAQINRIRDRVAQVRGVTDVMTSFVLNRDKDGPV
ncbi:MAG TPA: Lrp/AsnC family transcriptional regulator [Luteimonas sp.]|nr:Lrp/AsnC family transcriptional regulator [Luteimonas sp.]